MKEIEKGLQELKQQLWEEQELRIREKEAEQVHIIGGTIDTDFEHLAQSRQVEQL